MHETGDDREKIQVGDYDLSKYKMILKTAFGERLDNLQEIRFSPILPLRYKFNFIF
jgi:hypothetical protein